MDEKKAVEFLRCEASQIVDLAIAMANLTWKEETAVNLCARKDMTQEKAAESAGCSPDSMQRWYRHGMEKLCRAWDGVWWIDKLIQ